MARLVVLDIGWWDVRSVSPVADSSQEATSTLVGEGGGEMDVDMPPTDAEDPRPLWRRWLSAAWKALRPYGVASWRHPPRGA